MHREQVKCRLRRPPVVADTRVVEPDFSTFSANLHAAESNLLPHMMLTALGDAYQGLRRLTIRFGGALVGRRREPK